VRPGALLLVAAVVGLLGPTALAQEYPVREGTLASSSGSAIAPGELLSVSGGGFEPGGFVQVSIQSTPRQLGSTTADAAGTIDASVRIPFDMEAGDHTLSATGPAPGGGTLILSRAVQVTENTADASGAPGSSGSSGSGGGSSGGNSFGASGSGGTAEPATALAATGLATTTLAVTAMVCAAAGVGLLLIVRRRRRASADGI